MQPVYTLTRRGIPDNVKDLFNTQMNIRLWLGPIAINYGQWRIRGGGGARGLTP